MATLKDVAARAHVDISTVSRALNNTSYVHADTKKKILKVAKELGYRPNALARGLRQGRLNTIAIVVPMLSFSIFDEVVSGIEEEARKLGYSTLVVNTGGKAEVEKEALIRIQNGFIDGLVIAGGGENNKLIKKISAEMPVVQVVRKQDSSISSVVVDYADIGYQCTMHLVDQGCANIGLINGAMMISPYTERYEGYKKAIKKKKLQEITAERESLMRGMKYGYDCCMTLLDENAHLDAILAATDAQGIGVLRALKERGLRAPEDIKVVSMTGHRVGDMLETSLTSAELPGGDMGARAASLLIDQIESEPGREQPLQHIQYTAKLMERESSALT